MDDYKLRNGQSAKQTYADLSKTRLEALDTARELSEISIPFVFVPEGYRPGDRLGTNNQSVNSNMVSTLATKLMYASFPPSLPFVKYDISATALSQSADYREDPTLISKTKRALMKRANAHRERLESVPMRQAYITFLCELIIGGNSLFDYVNISEPTVRNLRNYVVKRDDRGNQLLVIAEKQVLKSDLDPSVLEKVAKAGADAKKSAEEAKKAWYEDTLPVYRVCETDTPDDQDGLPLYRLWEECEGVYIPGSGKTYRDSIPPMYAAWLIPMYGEDYGRAYCDLYRGDLFAVENTHAALQDIGAGIARMFTMVNPSGQTRLADVKSANNNDVIAGNAEDVQSYQSGKAGDLQALEGYGQSIERRLGRAFGSSFAVQRDAERVTREEWVQLTKALDEAMGGLHSQFSQTGQKTVTQMFIRLHEQEKEAGLKPLPKGVITMSVITGIDAYGQDTEASAIYEWRQLANEALGPEKVSQLSDDAEWLGRFTAAKNVTPDGLLKDSATIEQDNQQALMQGAMAQAAPGMMQEGAKAAFASLSQQQPPQTQAPEAAPAAAPM